MKKKGLLVVSLLAVCLLLTGCGKTKTLTCEQEESGQKMKMVIEYDTKKFEFKSISMEMTMPKSSYENMGMSEDELIKLACESDDESQKDCKAKITDDGLVATYELDAEKYGKELLDDEDIKADKDTLDNLKKSAEDDGATCKIK